MNQSVAVQSTQKWREEEGVIRRTVNIIRLSATVDGTTGPQWAPRLKERGCDLSPEAEEVLRSPDFTCSKPGSVEIAILRGDLFQDGDRMTDVIRAMADELKFIKPETDIGCIFREILSNEDIEAMGLRWIVMMHEPIDIGGRLRHLTAARSDDGRTDDGRSLYAFDAHPSYGWYPDRGFAFAVPQVES